MLEAAETSLPSCLCFIDSVLALLYVLPIMSNTSIYLSNKSDFILVSVIWNSIIEN